ncbi:MAG: hypothetical protein COA73_09000 [Candidatus Hydrogenedentota bacterium]|nr:MAG: hypothetical protein COA73_09000 [Candidatus Hydrogenedentota bacterium]
MALKPTDSQHALQILAGKSGRKRGHKFESELTNLINSRTFPAQANKLNSNVIKGDPAVLLISKALRYLNWEQCDNVTAIALGALATAEEGKKWLKVNGIAVKACKSDILLTLSKGTTVETVGVSVKQCYTRRPTNAQLYFTTATAFCRLLERNDIQVTENAIIALRQFCGDKGYRPLDEPEILRGRNTNPRRYFWEETQSRGRKELEKIMSSKQNEITKLLLQKAYPDDPFPPYLLIHKTRKLDEDEQEFALYDIDELVNLSREYSGFSTKLYTVRKGQYKDPVGIQHEAPRFGIIQMQRGGQKQHPTQLQFNLQAGYFYKI